MKRMKRVPRNNYGQGANGRNKSKRDHSVILQGTSRDSQARVT